MHRRGNISNLCPCSELLLLKYIPLVPEKTKLLCYRPPGHETHFENIKAINPTTIAGKEIVFNESAEHVGIICSIIGGNMTYTW